MIRHLRILLALLTFIFLFFPGISSASLLLHVPAKQLPPLQLSAQQLDWLHHKKILHIGILPNDAPPYGLKSLSQDYEGINADNLGLIAQQLGLKPQVTYFDDRYTLWRALANGEIDIVPGVTSYQVNNRFLLSDSYARDQPVLAVNVNQTQVLPADLSGIRVAMARDYLPLDLVRNAYPNAQIQVFDTYQQALSAVAYGQLQVFLGNSYHITRNYFNSLRIERLADLPPRQIGFALSNEGGGDPLHTLINQALSAIPYELKLEMQQYWQPDSGDSMSQLMRPLDLTPSEQQWIQEHPVINAVIYGRDSLAPAAFIDQSGDVHGIATDLLSLVSLKTGLRFSFRSIDTIKQLDHYIKNGEADMITASIPSDERQKMWDYTLPYARSAFALITAKDNQDIWRLSDLRGKRLAILRHAALAQQITHDYPNIKLVYYDNDREMLDSVADKKNDATIGVLTNAEFQIHNRYRDELKISTVVGDNTAYISFGIGKNNPQLRDIINKVLMILPPDELEILASRWRPNNMIVIDTFWSRNRETLIYSVCVFALLLMLVLARMLWLRNVVKKVSTQASLLEKVVDEMPFPISLRNKEGYLTYCNKHFLLLTGQPYEKVEGKLLTDQPRNISLQQAEYFHNKGLEVVASGKPYIEDIKVNLIDKNGNYDEEVTLNIWMLPWRGENNKIIGVIGGSWDISERASLLRKLEEASDRAEASNRAKSTFLSTMSHEIRTPMNAIIGMLDMAIKQGKQGKQDLQALEVAYDSAEGLVALIGDILDLSKVEGGAIEFRPVHMNARTLIDQLLVIFNGLALDKNIRIQKILPDEPMDDVIADPLRIKQILSNLLSNAIKFTDEGGVTLRLEQHYQASQRSIRYVIEVKDSGIGIDKEQQNALFKPFSQAENRRAGTGLGLYISRNLCESMGGSLTLTSELGIGTCARAELLLPIAEEKVAAVTNDEEQIVFTNESLNVLVVDDNAANRILLAKQLAWLGHHAHVAVDGEEGYALWMQNKFDIVITDCNMPGMNGYQLTQKIRATEAERNVDATWIIGFTANAVQEIVERCRHAGMDACLFKPCTLKALADAFVLKFQTQLPAPTLATISLEDRDFQKQLQVKLNETISEDLTAMQAAVVLDDWRTVGDLSHRMQGSVRIAKEPLLIVLCQNLEEKCEMKNENVPQRLEHWKKLEIEIKAWLSHRE